MGWFNHKKLALMKWPDCSPGFNPIENLRAILSYKVYANNRVFNSVQELMEAIETCWHGISIESLRMLIEGMPNRCAGFIRERGVPLKC